jgi:hypothetical protein
MLPTFLPPAKPFPFGVLHRQQFLYDKTLLNDDTIRLKILSIDLGDAQRQQNL